MCTLLEKWHVTFSIMEGAAAGEGLGTICDVGAMDVESGLDAPRWVGGLVVSKVLIAGALECRGCGGNRLGGRGGDGGARWCNLIICFFCGNLVIHVNSCWDVVCRGMCVPKQT